MILIPVSHAEPLDSLVPAEKRTGGNNLGPILFEQHFIKPSALFNIYIGASEASENALGNYTHDQVDSHRNSKKAFITLPGEYCQFCGLAVDVVCISIKKRAAILVLYSKSMS